MCSINPQISSKHLRLFFSVSLTSPPPSFLRTEYRIGSSEEERKISPEYHLQNQRELTKETMV